jgi:hypothetical protein
MTRVLVALAALAIAGAVGLVGCASGGGKSPGVASLAGSKSGVTTTTVSKQIVTQLYDLWAQCMRQHGVNMADPKVDTQGQISVNASNASQATFEGANKACAAQHSAAQKAAMGGQAAHPPDPAKLLSFAKCMRAHGLPDFPDPSGAGLQISSSGPSSDLNPDNPTFQKAQKVCQPILGSMKGGEKTQIRGNGAGPVTGGSGGGGLSGGAGG